MSAHIYIDCHHHFCPYISASTSIDAPNSPGNTITDINTNLGNAKSILAGSVKSSAAGNIPPPENPVGPSAGSASSPAPAGTAVLVDSSADRVGSPASGNTPAPASGSAPVPASSSTPVPAFGGMPVPASGGMPVPENPVGPLDDLANQGVVSRQGEPSNPEAEDNGMVLSSLLSALPPEGISTTVQKEEAPIDTYLHFRA